LAEIRAYKPWKRRYTRLAVDDELGVVFFMKNANGPPDGWLVVTVLRIPCNQGVVR
jgi:hypothetical protein